MIIFENLELTFEIVRFKKGTDLFHLNWYGLSGCVIVPFCVVFVSGNVWEFVWRTDCLF